MATAIGKLHTEVFTPPPSKLPLDLTFDFHYQENPHYPAFVHPVGKDESSLKFWRYRELVPAIHRAGQWISSSIRFRLDEAASSPAPVVALLLQTDNMTYLTMLSGLMRAGITAFPISSRFSAQVVAHLLKATQTRAIVFNSGTKSLANEALEGYSGASKDRPLLCQVPGFSFLFPGHDTFDALPLNGHELDDIKILTHSSSSSSLFPRVVPWSSSTILHHSEINDYPAHQYAGKILGAFGLDFFHSLGMCIFFTMIRRGLILGVLDPLDSRSIPPVSLELVFRSFERIRPHFFLTTPRVIELWAEDTEKVAILRESAANIVYGGRFLSKSVGDRLVRQGVRICSSYGSTETGPITLLPHFLGDDWEYWTIYPRSDLNFVARDDGLLELVVTPTGKSNYLPISNTTWNGQVAYNPGDLFIAHPIRSHTYKIFGRSSDQIMLASGEMVNPTSLESELTNHSLVASAVMFGHTRASVGIVIEPACISSEKRLPERDFINAIWPLISDYNRAAPPYARILRKMIVVAKVEKPILLSPKGLPRRPVVWHEYEDEIDALYADELKKAV